MPKSPERCAELRGEMRARILRESLRYFARNGFAGTRIADLARGIGIAQGTIYRYFDSKEDLFAASSWRTATTCGSSSCSPGCR